MLVRKHSEAYFFILEPVKADSARTTLLGSLNRLILTLYAPDSIYDDQVSEIASNHGIVCSKEAIPDELAGGPEDISGLISCGSVIALAMQESTSECCNASTGQIQSTKRRNETVCLSCGASLEADSLLLTTD